MQDKFVQIEDRSRVGVITVHSGFSSIDIEADFLDGCLHAISNGETAPSAFTADGQYAGGQGALFGAIALNADTRTGAYITKHIVRAFSIDDIESSAGFAVTRKIDSTIDRQSALVFPGLYGIVSIGKSFYMVSGDVAVGRDIAPLDHTSGSNVADIDVIRLLPRRLALVKHDDVTRDRDIPIGRIALGIDGGSIQRAGHIDVLSISGFCANGTAHGQHTGQGQ
ncbi:hypothetical protein [Desulfovibrio piger]|uniref:hypothetical protein n=1 Tax=Desulfovibrio piger TaxID=901 RepID=UPI00241FA7BE|nr:hypothetical protein [Desulfovibrio piger]